MKKLLITLGDSWTYGHGSYLRELEEKYYNNQISEGDLFAGSTINFIEKSWPVALAKHFNFDLLNIAHPGSSNSAQAKLLLDNRVSFNPYAISSDARIINKTKKYNFKLIENSISDINFKEYDKIVLIFMLTGNWRFSFYRNGKPQSFIPTAIYFDNDTGELTYPPSLDFYDFGLKYAEIVPEKRDHDLESAFYLTVVENFCKVHNIEFFYGSFSSDCSDMKPYFFRKNSILNMDDRGNVVDYRDIVESNKLAVSYCSHPNEYGYKLISDNMISILETKFSTNMELI